MNEYIKTIIYGITTSWQSKLNKLAKELRAYADGLVSPLTKKIAKAQTTADSAWDAADTAKSTANSAQSTADTAWETATEAHTTAETAKSTADNAQTTADNAQTTANSAQTAATAATTGGTLYANAKYESCISISEQSTECYAYMISKETKFPIMTCLFGYTGGAGLKLKIDTTNKETTIVLPFFGVAAAQAKFKLVSESDGKAFVEGLAGITLKSSTSGSTKQFRITVDDSGTLSATEVT